MRESDKHRFLDSPISQGRPIRRSGGGFANSSPPHRSRRRRFDTSCPGGPLLSPPHRRLQPLRLLVARAPSCCLHLRSSSATTAACTTAAAWSWPQETGAARLRPCQAREAPEQAASLNGRPGAFGSCSSGDGDCTTPSPGGGPGGESFVSFLFCSATDPGSVVPKTSIKEQFPFPPGPKRARMAVYETSSPHPRPPLSSPVGSRVRSEDATPSPASPAQLWSQVSVTPHTQTPLRDALPFESGPCAPFRCPTVGTSVTPLVPLARSLGAWLELPRPSRWLLRTIRLGYAIQFARRPPKFRGIRFTSVLSKDAPVLRAEVADPTGEGRDRAGPSSRDEVGVLQPLLHRTQERRWVTTNPGPARSESGPSQAPVQDVDAETHLSMRPSPRLVCSNRPEGRLLPCLDPPSTQTVSPLCVRGASIPVQGPSLRAIPVASCLHQGRRSRPCTVKGSRHSYPQLPRRLAHSGPVSSTVVRTQGYGAQSPQRLGLQVNQRKEQTLPCAEDLFSRHGVGLGQPHSTSLGGACSVMLRCLESLQRKKAVPLKHFQRLLGHMASSAAITPLGLLHMRPLQRWLHDRVPRWAWRHGTYRVSLTPSCRRTFSPWSDLAFLRAGVPLEQVSRHVVVSTDASATGWGAMCNGHAAAGLWTGPQLQWHINCLELLAVWLALRRFRTLLTREAHTGPLGQHCDRCVHQPPRRSTLPSHVATRPPSPPLESEASEVASRRSCPRRAQSCSRRALTSARPSGRMATPPRGTPADLETLRGRSGRPVCLPGHVSLPVVFLPVRGDPRYRCTGMQLASGLTQVCVSPSEPSRTDPVQGQGGRGASPLGCALLAQSDVVPRTGAPRDSPSLANSSEEGSTFSERGHPLAPAPRLVESPRMVLGRDAEVLSGLPPAVVTLSLLPGPCLRDRPTG